MDFDLTFYDRIPLYRYGVTPAMTLVLSSYGVDVDSLYYHGRIDGASLDSLKQSSSPFYYTNIDLQCKISKDYNKSRVLNEQLNFNIFT